MSFRQRTMACSDLPRTMSEWLSACHDDLVRFCERYLGQRADAEDVVQDVAAAASGRDDLAEPRAWLFRVARNRCLNILRDRRGDAVGAGNRLQSDLASPRTGPRTALGRAERDEALRAAIATLPPSLAEVLTLRYFEAFNRRQIAAVLERSENEVKSELARARAELARKLRALESRP